MAVQRIQGLDDNFLLKCLNNSTNYYDKTNPYLKRLETIIAQYQSNSQGATIEIDERKEMEKELSEMAKEYMKAVDDKNRVQNNFENELKDLFGVDNISKVKQEWIDVILSNGNLQNDTDFETEEEFNALLHASNSITPDRIKKLKNLSFTLGYSVEKERKAKVEVIAKREEIDKYAKYHKNEVRTYDIDEITERASELISRFREIVDKHDEQINNLIVEQTRNIETLRLGYQNFVDSCEDIENLSKDVYMGNEGVVSSIENWNSEQQYRFKHLFYDLDNKNSVGYTFGAYQNAVDIEIIVSIIDRSLYNGNLEDVVENLDRIERKINKMEILDREIDKRVEQTNEDTKQISSMINEQIEDNSKRQDEIIRDFHQIQERGVDANTIQQRESVQQNIEDVEQEVIMSDLELIEQYKKQLEDIEETHEVVGQLKDNRSKVVFDKVRDFRYFLDKYSRGLYDTQIEEKESSESLKQALGVYMEKIPKDTYLTDYENLDKKIKSDKLVLFSMVSTYIDKNILDLANKVSQIEHRIQEGKSEEYVKKHICKIVNKYQQLVTFSNQNKEVLQKFDYLQDNQKQFNNVFDLIKTYVNDYNITAEDVKNAEPMKEIEVFSTEEKEKIKTEIETNQTLVNDLNSDKYKHNALYNMDLMQNIQKYQGAVEWHQSIAGVGPHASKQYHDSLKEMVDTQHGITNMCEMASIEATEQSNIDTQSSKDLFVAILETSAKDKIELIEEYSSSYNSDFYCADKHVNLKKSMAESEFEKLSIINSTCDINKTIFDKYTTIKNKFNQLLTNFNISLSKK